MTRKKFVKMLMWAGMQRNDAAACAQLAQEAGRAYFYVLGDLLNYHNQHFKRPAFDLMWLRIRATIIHGANTPAWVLLRDIDEMHMHYDGKLSEVLITGLSKLGESFAENLAKCTDNLRDMQTSLQKLSAALGGGGHE